MIDYMVHSDSTRHTDGVDEPRYERKFALRDIDIDLAYTLLSIHPAQFKEIYSPRRVNNIYFDTYDFRHLHDSINGTSPRAKYRIRWYGDQKIGVVDSAQYEIKMKKGDLITKYVFAMTPFSLPDMILTSDPSLVLHFVQGISSKHAEQVKGMVPSLYNSYLRRYFLSSDKKFRVTVDTNISSIRLRECKRIDDRFAKNTPNVLEIKYLLRDDTAADSITSFLPFRLSRNSKYVSGFPERDALLV